MQLTDEQRQAVAKWVADGASLQDVQRRIKDEFGVALTYMDVRFLVIEVGAHVQDKPARTGTPDLSKAPVPPPGKGTEAEADWADDTAAPGAGGVSVALDRITKPGTLVSGSVTFSDGVRAEWGLDQTGRLALGATRPGYSPSPADITAFQMELRRALETRGF